MGGKESFQQMCHTTVQLYGGKKNLDPLPQTRRKMNLKWLIHLNGILLYCKKQKLQYH